MQNHKDRVKNVYVHVTTLVGSYVT